MAKMSARKDDILLSDRDFALFKENMMRSVEPNAPVQSEVAEFNKGRFDAQGRYHWETS